MTYTHIYISNEGELFALALTLMKPSEEAFRAADDLDGYLAVKIPYEQALAQSKKEGVRFKDQADAIHRLVYDVNSPFECQDDIQYQLDTIHELPSGYSIEVALDHEREMREKRVCPKLATLKKLDPLPMKTKTDLKYKVKCRSCGAITEMWFCEDGMVSHNDFKLWAREHSTFPIQRQCSCDNGSMLLHDLVSYSPII